MQYFQPEDGIKKLGRRYGGTSLGKISQHDACSAAVALGITHSATSRRHWAASKVVRLLTGVSVRDSSMVSCSCWIALLLIRFDSGPRPVCLALGPLAPAA